MSILSPLRWVIFPFQILFKPLGILFKSAKLLYWFAGAIALIGVLAGVWTMNIDLFGVMLFVLVIWSVTYSFTLGE